MRPIRLRLILALSFGLAGLVQAAEEKFDWRGPAGVGRKWPTRMADVAVPKDQLPKVVAGHPRLYVRSAPWPYGPSVGQLRERAKKEPWAAQFKKPPSAKYPQTQALYYLLTGDESVVPAVVEHIASAKPDRYGGPVVELATEYDWICSSPKVTSEQLAAMRKKLAELGHKAAELQDLDMWHHWGAGTCPTNVLAAGLALYGDDPEGERLLAQAVGFFRAAYLPGYQCVGGIWQGGGFAYYRNRAQWIPTAIYLWASGTEEDIFQTIRRDYGNWFEDQMYFFMYQVLPDRTRAETTGFDYAPRHPFPWTREFMIYAAGCRNPDPYAFLRWMAKTYKDFKDPTSDFLLYDEAVDSMTPRFPDKLPQTKLWGRQGHGYLQMRAGGWAADATVIEFECGDTFWSHTFHANQNSFYIYHKGRLAVHGGLYHDNVYYGDHMRHYFARTVASNSMLVIQPGEFSWTETSPKSVTGADENGFYPEYGGQRLVVGSGNSFTFAEYLARRAAIPSEVRKGSWQFWEMGDIPAFEHAADYSYSYVCGDATQAYNNPLRTDQARGRKNTPKIDQFTRSMAFLGKKYLVVFDRVRSLDASCRKVWLLHSQGRPEVGGRIIRSQVPGHIEDFDGDSVSITWADGALPPPDPKDPGRLLVRTFLPKERYIRRIGGEGYEFWVDGRNYPPPGEASDRPDMGKWRVEISPARDARADRFLNLLCPCDTATDSMPPAEMAAAEGGKMTGVTVGGWSVLFGADGEVAGQVAFAAPAGRTEHLLVDLKRGGAYRAAGIAGGERLLTASGEGTLRFATDAAGIVKLTPAE